MIAKPNQIKPSDIKSDICLDLTMKSFQNLNSNDLNLNAPNNNESVHNQFEKNFEIFSNNVNTIAPFENASRRETDYLQNLAFMRFSKFNIRKNKLFIKLQKCYNVAAFNDYKKYCNSLNRVMKAAKQNYYNEAIQANKNNQDQI